MKAVVLLAFSIAFEGIGFARSATPTIADPNHLPQRPTPAPPLVQRRPVAEEKLKLDPKKFQEAMLESLKSAPSTLKLKQVLDLISSRVKEPAKFQKRLSQLRQDFHDWRDAQDHEDKDRESDKDHQWKMYANDLQKRLASNEEWADAELEKAMLAAGMKKSSEEIGEWILDGVPYFIYFANGFLDLRYGRKDQLKHSAALDISALLRAQNIEQAPRKKIALVPQVTADFAAPTPYTVRGRATLLYEQNKPEPEIQDNDETSPLDWITIERDVLPISSPGLLTGNPLAPEKLKKLEQLAATP